MADGDDAEELHLLLRGGSGAEPVAGFEIGDGLAGDGERGADHSGDRHDEEHAGGAGDAEAQQDDGGDDDGEHRHAGHRIARGGGDGVGGDGGEEEGEEQRQAEADEHDCPRDRQMAEESRDGDRAHDDAEQDGDHRHIAVGAFAGWAASP